MGGKPKGAIAQRELVGVLRDLIDDAMRPQSTAHRDVARSKLRSTLAETNWETSFIFTNLSTKRCRYLASLGYPVPGRWLYRPKPEALDA